MACTFINGLATFGYMLAPDTAAMIALRMLHGGKLYRCDLDKHGLDFRLHSKKTTGRRHGLL